MDKLDDIVKGAMRSLDGTTPRGYFDELPGRIEARLEGEPMQSTESHDPRHTTDGLPPPQMTAGAGSADRVEDSGLHDIKELATTAKRRISRRITTQNEAQDALLSSSSSGLHAVALPDPAKMIALPTVDQARSLAASAPGQSGQMAAVSAVAAEVGDAPARAASVTPIGEARRARRGWVYAVGAVAAAAAAVTLFVVTRPGTSEPKADRAQAAAPSQPVARGGEQAAAPAAVAAGSAAALPATAPPAPSGDTLQVDVAEPADVGLAAAAPPPGEEAEGDRADAEKAAAPAKTKADDARAARGAGGATAKGEKADVKTDPKADVKADPKADAKPDAKSDPKADAKPDAKADGPKDDLDKSIEDLLAQPVEKKKVDKPDKTELSSKELRDGLSAKSGAAKACYGKYGVAGTVKVKVTIDPSGKVSKASATGDFAGTPSGECVAAALKEATFPAWDGAPMSTSYAVLLSD